MVGRRLYTAFAVVRFHHRVLEKEMTYRELLEAMKNLTEDQLDADISIEIDDEEFIEIAEARITEYDDILDADHFYLSVFKRENRGKRI